MVSQDFESGKYAGGEMLEMPFGVDITNTYCKAVERSFSYVLHLKVVIKVNYL